MLDAHKKATRHAGWLFKVRSPKTDDQKLC